MLAKIIFWAITLLLLISVIIVFFILKNNIWTIILVFILVILIGSVMLDKFLNEFNAQKFIVWGTILGAFGTISAVIFLVFQTINLKESIDLQTKTFNLDKRPYLYIHFEPYFKYESDGIYGGGEVSYGNEGQVPVSNIQTKFIVATDAQGEIDIKKKYNQKVGKEFPEVKTVFPEQISEKIPIHPSISNEAKFLFIGIVVTYSGIEKDNKYCYKFMRAYNLMIDDKKEKPILAHLVEADEDWDRNSGLKQCQLKEPNWNYKDYLGEHITEEQWKDILNRGISKETATTTIEAWK